MKSIQLKFLLSILLIACCTTISHAVEFKELLKAKSSGHWYYIKDNQSISARDFFSIWKETYDSDNSIKFTFLKSSLGENGILHESYQQYKNGNEVFGALIRVHSKNGQAFLVNGFIAENFNLSQSHISQDELLSIARNHLNCNKESENKKIFDPTVIKEVYYKHHSEEAYKRSYQVQGICENTLNDSQLIIDAENGEILFELPMLAHCNSNPKTHPLIYNDDQNFSTFFENNDYFLIDTCRSALDDTIKVMSGFGTNPVELIRNDSDNWNTGLQISGIQLLWGTARFYDFLKQRFGRNSFNNNYGNMTSIVDSSRTGMAGFSYSGNYSIHGRGIIDSLKYWVTLDIIGHEWTHGMLFSESVLLWSTEGQAVAESYCDIFGILAEVNIENDYNPLRTMDWFLGEDLGSGAIRNLASPGLFSYPTTFNSSLYNTTNDKYLRSSVNSLWFYLLSEGGSGTNDHSIQNYSYNVQGIGIENASDIIYESILHYLNPLSGYTETRRASLQAAEDLFGLCSNEYLNTMEAWNAVGVYDSIDLCNPVLNIASIPGTNVQIYPNPNNGNFQFESNINLEASDFTIRNTLGQVIDYKTLKISENTWRLELPKASNGLYFVQIENTEISKVYKVEIQ